MANRFEQADKIEETEDRAVHSMQEHTRISGLIFEDIIKEIYEKQINKYKENN
jgi:hypothetical protein